MIKARRSLPVTSRTLNRRALLGGASVSAAALVAPAAADALPSSAPLAAQPTALGRAVLAALTEYRAAWAGGDLTDDAANAATDRVYATITPLIRQIEAQPVTSLANLVDRAIAAAAHLGPDHDIEADRIMPLIEAVCGLAGLRARTLTI